MSRPPSPPPSPPPNTHLGPYALIDRIAAGGMAEVFRARAQPSAGEARTVVLKRMLSHLASEPAARAMFEEEARLGAFVRHPNVVEVLDHGEAETQPYLVLEHVPGVDLWRLTRALAREGRALGVQLSMVVIRDLLTGLHAVHEARDARGAPLGIVHRDVSPSNVLLSTHGDVKLGDFGIARRVEESYHHGIGGRKGKLGYLAPEQVNGADIDRRTDVFAAAVIAAELLIGRPLFSGGSELAILLAIRDASIGAFEERIPSLPEGLGETITQALQRDKSERTPSADALRRALEPFQQDPEPALRRELGELVAHAAGTQGAQATEPASDGADSRAARTLVAGSERITTDVPPLEHHVRTSHGQRHGPWSYARVVQAISTGELGADDRVSIGGGAFRPIRDMHELQPHLPTSARTPITREAEGPVAPAEVRSLAGGGWVAALATAALRRDTGLWLCDQGGVRKEVYISLGVPEFVTSNRAGELLGEYLVAHGVLSRGELDMALAVMPRFEGRLGETLIRLGLVQPLPLFRHIAMQVREKLVESFLWDDGAASFYRGVPPPARGFPLGLDPWAILDEGIHRRLAHGLEERLRTRAAAPVRRAEPPPHLRVDRLPGAARQVLDTLDGPQPLTEATQRAAAVEDPSRGERAAVLLLALGAIEWVDNGPSGG